MANSDILFGAIRWDAEFAADNGPVLMKRLSPAKFRYRAPVRSVVHTSNVLTWTMTQADLDDEIAQALSGNLSYWAFLRYGTGSTMNAGLALYQTSSKRTVSGKTMRWASMESSVSLGGISSYGTAVQRLIAEMQQTHYQKVLTNRPLLYLFISTSELAGWWSSSAANVKVATDAIRNAAITSGLGDPYIVGMNGTDTATATAFGVDAVSTYVAQTGGPALARSYVSMDTANRNWWTTLAASYSKVVVPCVMGWDRRPRIERPVPWEYATQKPYVANTNYTVPGTPPEIAAHVSAAIDFIRANPEACDSKAILAYAWNEIDEGGWLEKTLGDPTGDRLSAVAAVLA